jgi:D-alanyl-D-alanine carboxypeptidase
MEYPIKTRKGLLFTNGVQGTLNPGHDSYPCFNRRSHPFSSNQGLGTMGKINSNRLALSILYLVSCLFPVVCALRCNSPVSGPDSSTQNTHPDSVLFQGLLDRYVGEGIPGVVLYVQTPQGLWNGAAGFAKIETATRMQPTNLFDAASVTKVYTAAAVMLLVEDRVIELDATISRYLPDTVCSRLPNGTTATVRQLLNHTSGIPDFSGTPRYLADLYADPMGEYPVEKLLGYVYEQAPVGPAGTVTSYSNTNYFLLAMIMDCVAGSHAKIISERILKPAGLKATYYKNEAEYPSPPGMVDSYEDIAGDGNLMNVTAIGVHLAEFFMGNAGLIASSADFARFLNNLLGGKVVGPESLAMMRDSSCGLDVNYTGYGYEIGRSGSDFGALIKVSYFPDSNATIVLLMNAGEGGGLGSLFWNLWGEALSVALSGE